MIRVRVSNSFKAMKQDYIEYVTVNRLHIIYTGIIKQVMDSNGDITYMTLEKFLFMMCYKGSKFVKQGNREIEIITDDDLTEDMKNAEVKRYREDIKRDGIIIEIDIPIMVC